ncbi:MAG: DNA-binding protein WhiA [Hungatella sp.]|nr:DNA-binding protein WhiA [Hungatella sp.]
MSFSSGVKEELSRQISPARHCRIAEIAAIISLCGKVQIDEEECYQIKISTENAAVARKYFTLLKKTFNINTDILIRRNAYLKKNPTFMAAVSENGDARKILLATKLLDEHGEVGENLSVVGNLVIQNPCCRRAFLRGAFLAAGSISDPEKFYHYEIASTARAKAEQLQSILATFDVEARIVQRKKYFVVYVKEGNQIVNLLNIMEAPVALMELENIRILKEMRGSVNRQVNCETANINKTVSAAVKQIEDIRYIRETIGLEKLQESLYDIAKLRLERPEATLKELGEALDPPVGKSGVNHRLKKLSILADELREKRGSVSQQADRLEE